MGRGRHGRCIAGRGRNHASRAALITRLFDQPVRGFLLRIVLFTAQAALDRAPIWRALTAAADIDVIAFRCVGEGEMQRAQVVGLTREADREASTLRVRRGEALGVEALVGLFASWDAEIGIILDGHVPSPELLRAPRFGSHALAHGWLGKPGMVAAASGVACALHAAGDPTALAGGCSASAVAPAYADDTLTDLERRAAELSIAVVRETIHQLRAGATPPQALALEIRRWPAGAHRTWTTIRIQARRTARRLLDPRWLVKTLAALAVLGAVAPARRLWRTVRRRHAVHIFTFHRVSELCRDGMTVRPAVFARQLAAIQRSHRVLGLREAIALVASGARLTRPVAVITFDDAYRSVVDSAAPLMAGAGVGVTGCCFVSTGLVGVGRRFAHDADNPVRAFLEVMSWGELALLQRAGWELGAHTVTHPRLSQCNSAEIDRELGGSAAELRTHNGGQAMAFAYPFGGEADITPFARRMAASVGYLACLSDFGGENIPPGDPFVMRRIELGGDHDALAWRVRLTGLDLAAWRPRWFRRSARAAEVMRVA